MNLLCDRVHGTVASKSKPRTVSFSATKNSASCPTLSQLKVQVGLRGQGRGRLVTAKSTRTAVTTHTGGWNANEKLTTFSPLVAYEIAHLRHLPYPCFSRRSLTRSRPLSAIVSTTHASLRIENGLSPAPKRTSLGRLAKLLPQRALARFVLQPEQNSQTQ